MNFPKISNITDLQPYVAEKTEIRFMTQPNRATVCCYMVSSEGTFDTKEAQECRGITFDTKGNVISRPLHKFFNVNEKESTQTENVNWASITRVMQKRDGSMITTVAVVENVKPLEQGLKFCFKSKKSFESDVVKQSSNWLLSQPQEVKNDYIEFCDMLITNNFTAIFEWTSPTSRIVIAYPQEVLTLLHVRHNNTGEYQSKEQLEYICDLYNIPLVQEDSQAAAMIKEDYKKLINFAETTQEDIEGWVFQLANGDMFKLKTSEYIKRHRVMTFLRVRDIALMVLEEKIDDIKASLVGEGVDISEILKIEADVVAKVDSILKEIDEAYAADKHLERKDFAIKNKGHKYFGLLMQAYIGKEPSVKEFYIRNMLADDYDLRQLNLLQTTAEAD